MAENLFGSAVPALANAADGSTNYALGTRFSSSVGGTVTHGRWRFPTTIPHPSTQVQVGVYRVSDQVLLGSASFPLGSTLGAWNQVAFSSPIPISAGVTYAVVVWTPLRYVATTNYAWPVTSASLTAGAANGWLATNPGGLVFPATQSGNGASYFADVVFEPSAAGVTHSGSGSGASVSAGSAAALLVGAGPVTHAAAGSGGSTSAGSAAVTLRLVAAASGASVSAGSAAARSLLVAAASGGSTSAGSAAGVVFGQVVTRPYTGTTVQPTSGVTARPFTGVTTY